VSIPSKFEVNLINNNSSPTSRSSYCCNNFLVVGPTGSLSLDVSRIGLIYIVFTKLTII